MNGTKINAHPVSKSFPDTMPQPGGLLLALIFGTWPQMRKWPIREAMFCYKALSPSGIFSTSLSARSLGEEQFYVGLEVSRGLSWETAVFIEFTYL